MRFVFARSEIDRREILRRDLAVYRHRERNRDERAFWARPRLTLPAR